MKFRNPQNDHIESSGYCALWALLFGSFYFAYKGAWGIAIISFLAAWFTFGLSWFVFPFLASRIIRSAYLRRGWIQVFDPPVTKPDPEPIARDQLPVRRVSRLVRNISH